MHMKSFDADFYDCVMNNVDKCRLEPFTLPRSSWFYCIVLGLHLSSLLAF